MPSPATNKFMRYSLAEGRVERAAGCCHYCGMVKHRGSIFRLWKCAECGAVLCSNQMEDEHPDYLELFHFRWSHGWEEVADIDGSSFSQTYFKPVSCGPLAEVDLDVTIMGRIGVEEDEGG